LRLGFDSASSWLVGFGFSDFLSKSVDGGFEEFFFGQLVQLRLLIGIRFLFRPPPESLHFMFGILPSRINI
jgi:hypothetical protein